MKMSHEVDWVYKYPADKFNIEYDFTNDLDVDTLASVTASVYNSSESLVSGMISAAIVSTPDAIITLGGGTAGETYNIKVVGTSSTYKKYTHYIKCEVFGNTTINTKLGDSGANSYVTLKEANDYIRSKYGHDSRWDTLTIEGKKHVLLESAKEINYFNFIGEKYYETQALEFPRDDHDVITGNCGTPITRISFKNTSLKSSTYNKYPTDFWKSGTCHITTGTPLYDVRNINTSNALTGLITLTASLSGTPTTNTKFKIFEPLDSNIKNAQCEQALYILDNQHAETLQSYRDIGAKSVTIGEVSVDFVTSGSSERVAISPLAKKLLSRWIRKNLKIARA